MSKFLKTALILLVTVANSVFAQSVENSPEQKLEKLLEAMGGRSAWASITGVKVTATHYTTRLALPHKNIIWNDFSSPRLRIEANSSEINRLTILEKDAGWRKDEKETRVLSSQEVADEQRWWESNPYRTLQRLAKRDAELIVKMIDGDRLGIFRQDGVRLNWFRLNQTNEPIAFGTWNSEEGSVFGPLNETTLGIRHPRWTARPDGRWRAEIAEFQVYQDKIVFDTGRR